jgi:hypothetical protein
MPLQRPADGFVFTPPTKEELDQMAKEAKIEEDGDYPEEYDCLKEKSFWLRHPWLTFVLVSPVAVPAMLFVAFVWSLPDMFANAEKLHKRTTKILAKKDLQ